MKLIIQPYCDWDGHYYDYLNNLKIKNSIKVYCDSKIRKINHSIFIKTLVKDYRNNFLNFILSRIFNFLKVILFLTFRYKNKSQIKTIHFLEFEPISILIYLFLNIFRLPNIIITIHSINPTLSNSLFKNIIIFFQRFLFIIVILLLNLFPVKIVVHSQNHKKKLSKIFKNRIKVFNYPCEIVRKNNLIKIFNKKILFFGLVREDKGIIDFVKKNKLQKLVLTIAGKVNAKSFFQLMKYKNLNIRIKNKYFNKQELEKLFLNHDYLLLPYKRGYAGSAGPMHISLSYGLPILCSNIEIFRVFLKKNKVGVLYNDYKFEKKILSINRKKFSQMKKNCISFSKKNTWYHLSKNYQRLYDEIKQ